MLTRGFAKIEGAIRAFNFDFRGKVVLDIGSSTGGFTEAALNHGAKKVIAVEKGSHQMKSPLRFDPRVELHEKTDIFNYDLGTGGRNLLFAGPPEPGKARLSAARPCRRAERTQPKKSNFGQSFPDIIVADVSFISLRPILKYAKHHLAGNHTDFLVMLKPQFEAKPHQLWKGVVKNEKIRREIIKDFEYWLKQNGFIVIKKRDNDLPGRTGNLERFYFLRLAK